MKFVIIMRYKGTIIKFNIIIRLEVNNDYVYTAWVGLMVKSMCFLLRGHRYKTKGGEYVCLRRLSSQIIARRWVPCPTNKGISYTNLVSGLVVTLKLDDDNNNNMDIKL